MRNALNYGLAIAALSAVLMGCPELAAPPFDATGDYEGAWVSSETESNCALSLSLTQKADWFFPLNHQIVGTASFSYACLLDNALLEQIQDQLPELTLPLFGNIALGSSGEITLGIDSSIVDLPFTIAFQLDGEGADITGDGLMDTFTGTYTLDLVLETTVQGYETVEVHSSGAFDVATTEQVVKLPS